MKTYLKLILFPVLYLGWAMMNSASVSASYEEPVYYLQFSVSNADIEVRLNDIPVLHHDAPGTTSSEKPVPESIIDGENFLLVQMSPLEGEDNLFVGPKSADISLVVREKNAPLNQYETLIHIQLNAVDDEGRVLADSGENQGSSDPILVEFNRSHIVAKRSADINSPFPRWAWQDGEVIEESQDNYESLLDTYKEIYRTLKSEDIGKIKDLYSHAAREFATAYHHDDVEQGHRVINTGSLVGDPEWVLGDIFMLLESGFVLQLDVYGNGKLARLVDEDGDDGGIAYLNKNVEMVSFQKFGFYKDQNEKWVMIR